MTILPTVSIVILNHNYEQYVAEAIESALTQKPGAYILSEVAVIDDGSTDGSHEIYRRYPDLRVVCTRNYGFGATLTRAVREARGDWVAFLDADDAFEPAKLRTLAPILADPAVSLVRHGEHVVDSSGAPFAEGYHPGGATSTLLARVADARSLLPISNELFLHVLAAAGRGRVVADPLTRYRVHDQSMTDRSTPGVFATYMAQVCEDISARLDQLVLNPPPWATREQLLAWSVAHRDKASRHRSDAHQQINERATR